MTCTEQYYLACIVFCLFCVTFIAFVLVTQCALVICALKNYLLTYELSNEFAGACTLLLKAGSNTNLLFCEYSCTPVNNKICRRHARSEMSAH